MSTIAVWQVTKDSTDPIQLQDLSSLDAITRQLPEGYYSTFRTYHQCTRVVGLKNHLRRLYQPVPEPDVNTVSLRRELRELLRTYHADEARVRAVMTAAGNVYIAIEPLKELPREVYERGVRVETTELQRQHPRLKSTMFIGRSAEERKHIALEGIFEALLVKDGKILEGMTSNFFYVTRASSTGKRAFPSAQRYDILCTARDDILLGVTRKTVIAIARGIGLEVKYVPLKRNQLTAAEETFITSSSRGVVPVIQIDDVIIGQGSPGPITRELMRAYAAYVLEKAEKI